VGYGFWVLDFGVLRSGEMSILGLGYGFWVSGFGFWGSGLCQF